jgi:hypothetical protein
MNDLYEREVIKMYISLTDQEIEKFEKKYNTTIDDEDIRDDVWEYLRKRIDGDFEIDSIDGDGMVSITVSGDLGDTEVEPAWTEEYLNSLGMSKRDFF